MYKEETLGLHSIGTIAITYDLFEITKQTDVTHSCGEAELALYLFRTRYLIS